MTFARKDQIIQQDSLFRNNLKADMKYPVGPDVKTNQYQKAISQEVNLVEVKIYVY